MILIVRGYRVAEEYFYTTVGYDNASERRWHLKGEGIFLVRTKKERTYNILKALLECREHYITFWKRFGSLNYCCSRRLGTSNNGFSREWQMKKRPE